jgi:lipopolysaccharide cholinephosphotransferase
MIDELLQKQLRGRFNPDGSLLRQHQLRMLDMLRYIDAICRKHNIKYWLCSGTLIGAVRHGGFIPWDDDVDIEMLRDDYKKFVKVMREEPQTDYVLQTHETDRGYFTPYGKLRDLHSYLLEDDEYDSYNYHGIYVDIFIMEQSSSLFLSKISASIQGRLLPLFVKKNTFSNFVYFIIYDILFRFFRSVARLNYKGVLRHTFGTYFFKQRYKSDIFPLKTLFFEGTPFFVPGDYDSYLRKIYGDYMKLPEPDNIKLHVVDLKMF